MLRRLSTSPLSRMVLSKTVLYQARPSLAVAASRLCDFSTIRRSRAEKPPVQTPRMTKGDNKDSTVAKKQASTVPAFSPFARSMDDFIGRPFFARDPFAPFFTDPFFEEFHREMMPILRSPMMMRPTSFADHRVQLKETPGDDEKGAAYEISVDIPQGLQHPNLKVELERDGTVVHVSGERHEKTDDTTTTTRFSKRFAVGNGLMDTDNLQAHWNEDKGYLTIRAPKLEPQPKSIDHDTTRQITITTNRKAQQVSDEELRQKTFNDAFDESDSIETGKKQQQTA
eukprot:scaffold5885_cov201-Amphora_coffeaeformis.AAC.12